MYKIKVVYVDKQKTMNNLNNYKEKTKEIQKMIIHTLLNKKIGM